MKRLVDFPSSRQAPPAVLRQLREIDASAELVYFGAGVQVDPDTGQELFGPRWLLGAVDASREGRRRGDAILHQLSQRWVLEPEKVDYTDKLRLARLAQQGFAVVQTYLVRDPDSAIVEDFRLADHLWRTDADGAFDRVADAVEGGPKLRAKLARTRDAVLATARDAHRHAVRQPLTTSGSGRFSRFGTRAPRGRSLYD